MRSAQDLKDKWLAELPSLMARTGMYAMNATHVQDGGKPITPNADPRMSDHSPLPQRPGPVATEG